MRQERVGISPSGEARLDPALKDAEIRQATVITSCSLERLRNPRCAAELERNAPNVRSDTQESTAAEVALGFPPNDFEGARL